MKPFLKALALTLVLAFIGAQELSAQTNPVNVGWAVRSNVTSQGVAVSGDYLYSADYRDGLSIWNISSRTNPILTGYTTTNFGGYARRVAVAGDFAYVVNGVDGMRVYDVSNPSNPVNVGHVNDLYNSDGTPRYNDAEAWDIMVSGVRAYVANGFDGLRIYDISNPAVPVNVGHKVFNNGGQYACGVALYGHYAFLADYVGLSTYDVSDPTNPLFLGTTNCNFNGGYAFSVSVSGHYAYVANQGDGLRVFDVSNPALPLNIGHINNGGSANGTVATAYVMVSGNYAYLANNTDGVRVYDVSNPSNPLNIAVAPNVFGGYSKHIALSGSYAFVANSFDGVRIHFLGNSAFPLLQLSRNESTVDLSWPAPAAAFQVQESPDLSFSTWGTLTNDSEVVGSRNRVFLPQKTGNWFYRLKSL